jgi:hypothetical protein
MDESVTTGDVVNTADALWAVDIIRPVDQQVECPSLDKLNAALKLGIQENNLPKVKAIPYGTALPFTD